MLIIDKDEHELQCTAALLADTYAISCCSSAEDAYTLLQTTKFDSIILDLSKNPENYILGSIKALLKASSKALLLCIGFSIPASVIVSVLKNGAGDFVEKPFTAVNLRAKLLSLLQDCRPAEPSGFPIDLFEKSIQYGKHNAVPQAFLGHSKIIVDICELISCFAKHEGSVLILGESGTGKELAAGEIHRQSKRSRKPFVPADCASIPEHLAESYLFGTELGAYTGATRRKGFFEAAEGGSLFLDELGELALPIQAKLLRVLETRSGSRMGTLQLTSYDVRLISATSSPILNDSGRFRRDLLQRIDTLLLEMPPLRVHAEDIPEMAISFLARIDNTKILTSLAIQKLCEWHWPGNVRELKNVIERAAVLSESRDSIQAADINTKLALRWGGMQQCLNL